MFSFNKKIDSDLKALIEINSGKNYRVLIKYRNFPDTLQKKISSYRGTFICLIKDCSLICANINSKAINRLLEYPEVQYICLDRYLFLCGTSISTANKIRLTNKSNLSGRGVGIGIIDSGVYPHKDLTLPENRIGTFLDLINSLSYPYDDNGHGSCTCGIIAGNGEASNGAYKGIAPGCTLHVVKSFDKLGKGYASNILMALAYLIENSSKYNIKVICLPFEQLNFNLFIYRAFDKLFIKAKSLGIICVLPSGSNKNDEGTITGLALNPNCITVSGVNTLSTISSYEYSSCGGSKKDTKPDFTAACVDIVSLNSNTSYYSERNNTKVYAPKLDTSYKSFTGTSIAAAYVAGVCVLLYENNPRLSYDDILSLLKLSSESLNLDKYQQGAGKININNVLK